MSRSRKDARPALARRVRVERAFALRNNGLSIKEIAREMGVADSTVYSFFQDPDSSKRTEARKRINLVGRKGMQPIPPEERFWSHVVKGSKEDDCWLWKNHTNPKSHPQFTIQRTPCIKTKAHRFAYEILVGNIPDGHVVHHTCEVKHCVNPLHLELKRNQAEHARDHKTFLGDKGRKAQLKGADTRHRNLMEITLSYVLSEISKMMIEDAHPVYASCAKIKGYVSVYRYFSHGELLEMARSHYSYEATREQVLAEWRED